MAVQTAHKHAHTDTPVMTHFVAVEPPLVVNEHGVVAPVGVIASEASSADLLLLRAC